MYITNTYCRVFYVDNNFIKATLKRGSHEYYIRSVSHGGL